MIDFDAAPFREKWLGRKAQKAARTVTISSGGKRRDRSLNPIVSRVRRQLIALVSEHSNRAVLKYSEDQLRDERGRFAAGGSDDSPRERQLRAFGIARQYATAHPSTKLYLPPWGLLNPDYTGPALAQLSALQSQFPHVVVSSIGSRSMETGRLAETDPRNGSIYLNTQRWGYETQGSPFSYRFDNGFTAVPTVEGTITHEFGHLVQNALVGGTTYDNWAAGDFRGFAPVSTYAGTNDGEKFAELFAKAFSPGPGANDPNCESLRQMIKASGTLGY
jgi:hypothetical protein